MSDLAPVAGGMMLHQSIVDVGILSNGMADQSARLIVDT